MLLSFPKRHHIYSLKLNHKKTSNVVDQVKKTEILHEITIAGLCWNGIDLSQQNRCLKDITLNFI